MSNASQTTALQIAVGQYSDKGRKPINQDCHGLVIPREPLLSSKGIAIALADGISSSDVGHVAAESAVKSFLEDYYCTSEAWSVKTAAQRVLNATNSWLHAQTRRSRSAYSGDEDRDRGYVCTFSALVLKGAGAHLFHVGDARIWRVSGTSLEQLTEDHRVILSSQESYLSRALGVNARIEIDYRALAIAPGDVFLLATDGIHEHVEPAFMLQAIAEHTGNLDEAARSIAAEALRRGSNDNLTIQILRIEAVSEARAAGALVEQSAALPLPPLLEPRMIFDGYKILRELHASSRSHVYLAADTETGVLVTLKLPSIDLRGDETYLKRFMLEEWVARRINSAHVLKPCPPTRKRSHLYLANEYIEGQTLAQWMIDNPKPDLEIVRGIVEQIAKGLQAFHRMEMLHQDLRPENIMIDRTGTVKIIDFGAVRIAGVAEAEAEAAEAGIPGTLQYAAPEYFLGEAGDERADLYSLAAITYQMLSGRLPYGAAMARTRTRAAQRKLKYRSLLGEEAAIPAWIDAVLHKALQPDPNKRHEALSEFIFDLRHPKKVYLNPPGKPFLERNPLIFWQALSAVLALIVLALVAYIAHRL